MSQNVKILLLVLFLLGIVLFIVYGVGFAKTVKDWSLYLPELWITTQLFGMGILVKLIMGEYRWVLLLSSVLMICVAAISRPEKE